MNFFYVATAFLALTAQVYSQCIPPCAAPVYAPNCGCGCAPAPLLAAPTPLLAAPAPVVAAPAPIVAPAVVQPASVASTLADTLSLLTVSSLLAEKLPYGYPVVAPPLYPGCGCGYGYIL